MAISKSNNQWIWANILMSIAVTVIDVLVHHWKKI